MLFCVLFLCYAAIGLVQKGVVAIVGPQSLLAFEATQRLCEHLDVPQIAIKASGLNSFMNPCNNEYVLHMRPADVQHLRGIVAFIKHFGWKRVAVMASYDKTGQLPELLRKVTSMYLIDIDK